ncbi:MAG TPA: DNA-processing protein DprA [Burkholderiaceae bacterium]|nr:DNA-processing protein DprA [Burkholderiaceae bacterium]
MPSNLSDQELDAWIRLSLEPGVGSALARRLLGAIGLPPDIFALPASALAQCLPLDLARQLSLPPREEIVAAIEQTRVWLGEPDHHLLTLADAHYPAALLDTYDPPPLLYVNGNPECLARPIISIVGARHASPGGEDNARAFARHLAERGWCIASGLALGIDAAAHDGALLAGPDGGGTIAVMGTGIDIIYPARNHDLAHRIAQSGALVSELPLGTRALPHQFPKRNRIVAGLARGVLVVEAARQSGSLITARLATEAGREVFAIPGSIHSPLSHGCHALIRQGAKLVESGQDIHDELGQARPASSPAVALAARTRLPPRQADPGPRTGNAKMLTEATTAEQAAVLEALGHDPISLDVVHARTRLGIPQINQSLLELELAGRVDRLDDGRFQRHE